VSAVELIGVTKRYALASGSTTPVDGVSLSIAAGESVGICGPSGSGKSTLLRLAAGIERPDAGEVVYGRQPAWGTGRRARYPRPGYVMAVFQDPFTSLDPRWPIWRSLTEPLVAHRVPRGRRREFAASWLVKAHMDPDLIEARPGELSGGQCQRAALCRAFIAEPALLVADEPSARLDVITAAAVGEMLRHATGEGMALVVVSHHLAWLSTVTDRVFALRAGAICATTETERNDSHSH
jgi:peptide/nickel transport system ATP-binding protein